MGHCPFFKQCKKLTRIFGRVNRSDTISVQAPILRQFTQQNCIVFEARSINKPRIGIARRQSGCGLQQGMPGEARQSLLMAQHLFRTRCDLSRIEVIEQIQDSDIVTTTSRRCRKHATRNRSDQNARHVTRLTCVPPQTHRENQNKAASPP